MCVCHILPLSPRLLLGAASFQTLHAPKLEAAVRVPALGKREKHHATKNAQVDALLVPTDPTDL